MNLQDASSLSHLVLTGQDLTISQVISVARFGAMVSFDSVAKQRVQQCRDVVDAVVEHKMVIYGISTGFGALRTHIIPNDQIVELQQNLIRSHACGVGEPLSPEVVRAVILLRANTLARGNSGVRVALIDTLLNMLNLGITPWIPSQGSVGSSGDLCPLSHMALVLMGDPAGKFMHWHPKANTNQTPEKKNDGQEQAIFPSQPVFLSSTPENLKKFGFVPISLSYKEGLALNNGTQTMSALASVILYDSYWLLHTAEIALCMSWEGLQGVTTALDERIHAARPLAEQQAVAKRMQEYLAGSVNLSSYWNGIVLKKLYADVLHLQKYCQEQLPNDAETIEIINNTVAQLQKIVETETKAADVTPNLPWKISYHIEGLQQAQNQARTLESVLHTLENKVEKQCLEKGDEIVKDEYKPLQRVAALARSILDLTVKAVPSHCPTQDDYSFRCSPQVLACAWRAWQHASEVITTEINSATDNPLIFPPTMPSDVPAGTTYRAWLSQHPELCLKAVISGGNFHGEPVGMVMDYLAIALAEVASISERRTAHLVDANHNHSLPAFLMEDAGLNSGMMIPQYTAAALVSENKVLAHPATVDSIPTSANTEDHVSMATIAARKCLQILQNTTQVVAIEICTGHQALYFRFFPPSPIIQKIRSYLETLATEQEPYGMGFVQKDIAWYPRIATVSHAIATIAHLGGK